MRFTPKSGQWLRGHDGRGQWLFVIVGVESADRGVPTASGVEDPVANCSNQFSGVREGVVVLVLESQPQTFGTGDIPASPMERRSPHRSHARFMISVVY